MELSKRKKNFSFLKRFSDIVISIIAILFFSPIMIIIILCIWIDDPGPVLFIQERTGINGVPFNIYKFRSMKVNVEKINYSFNCENGVPDDFLFKSMEKTDHNVTRVGNIIRKTSLDELPQFFNTLFGNMSIIGPRPEIPEISNYYNDHQKKRLLIKPGITGLAQVNGRSYLTTKEKIDLDIFYIKHQSLALEIQILWKTIEVVFTSEGAV